MQTSTKSTSIPAPLSKGDLVLVTGITGFIGVHVADQLLKAGYSVRGTARSGSRDKDYLLNLFAPYGNKFELIDVSDLSTGRVFDDAVKDVDAIAHVASPVIFNATDPFRDLITPAVNGTLSLLDAALQYGTKVKQVVITSSVAAIAHPLPSSASLSSPYRYTEADWNHEAIEAVKDWKEGQPFDNFAAYIASKNEAEKAAWRFVEENQPRFGVSTILPVFTFGPIIHRRVSKPEDINGSNGFVWRLFSGLKKEVEAPNQYSFWVDVRDVALAHVRALEKGGGGLADVDAGDSKKNRRYILSAGKYSDQQIVDILRAEFPESHGRIPEGTPGSWPDIPALVSSEKTEKELGIQFRSLKESLIDTAHSIERILN